MKHRDSGGPEDMGPSQRQLRVGEELRHALVHTIDRAHFRDPDLMGVSVTITEVRVSPDLKNATAYVTRLGGENVDSLVAALKRAAPYLRGQIAKAVKLRVVPGLTFAADTSFDYASYINDILHSPDVSRDLAAEGEPDEDGDDVVEKP
ncbi:MAG TPA: 30S ribosome-binding factor RbfA [Alphaproteobacteria bacterium]|jgi:ribosome-binding factor A